MGEFDSIPKTRWKLGMYAFLATCGMGGAGYYAWTQRQAYQHERDQLQARSSDAETKLASAQGTLTASQQELDQLRKWKADTSKRFKTFLDMSKKLQKMVDAGKLGVRVRDGRLVMRMPQDVLFPSGSATLSREGELNLMEVAVILRQFPDRRFMVAGHTDSQPIKDKSSEFKDNWELSMARALVVARFMIEAKMNPVNMVVAGYGEFDPIAKNSSPEGRKENRRIEIILLPDLSELPQLPEDMAQAAAPK